MNLCEAPDWLQYAVLGLAVLPHVRAQIPPKAQGAFGAVLAVLDVIAANYRHCKNAAPAPKAVDEQHKVTPRP